MSYERLDSIYVKFPKSQSNVEHTLTAAMKAKFTSSQLKSLSWQRAEAELLKLMKATPTWQVGFTYCDGGYLEYVTDSNDRSTSRLVAIEVKTTKSPYGNLRLYTSLAQMQECARYNGKFIVWCRTDHTVYSVTGKLLLDEAEW